jgi:hypothetical protein
MCKAQIHNTVNIYLKIEKNVRKTALPVQILTMPIKISGEGLRAGEVSLYKSMNFKNSESMRIRNTIFPLNQQKLRRRTIYLISSSSEENCRYRFCI